MSAALECQWMINWSSNCGHYWEFSLDSTSESMVHSHLIFYRYDLYNDEHFKGILEDRIRWCSELTRRADTSPAKDAETP